MKIRVFILFLLMTCFACKTDKTDTVESKTGNKDGEMQFDREKWQVKKGKNYLYRSNMLNDLVYNDTIRTLTKDELLSLLGEPDYTKENHLYYRIEENRLGSWTLKTKTMVVKLKEDKSIEWIKIHGG